MSSRTVFPHWFSIYFKVHPKLMENHQKKFIFIWCIPSKAPFFHLKKKQSVQLSSFYIAAIRSSKHWQVFYEITFPEMFFQSAININARRWEKHLLKRNVMRHVYSHHIKLTTKRILRRKKKTQFWYTFTHFEAQELKTSKQNNLFPKSSGNHVPETFGIGQ